MKKVVLIGPTPPPYHGVTKATNCLINSQLRKHFKLIHLDTSDHRDMANMGSIDFINLWLAVKNLLTLVFYCIRYNPNLVYIPISQTWLGYARDGLFILIAKWFSGSKVLIHLHGSYFRKFYEESNILVKFIIRKTLKCVSRAIVLGENLKYIFEGLVSEEKVVVVHNGINKNIFENYKSINSERMKEYPKILFISYLAKAKGFIDVIKAIPEVLQHYKTVEFIFAGEPWLAKAEEEEVNQVIDSKGLGQNIKFEGVVAGEKKNELLLSGDIFLLPSYNEGQPFAIIEAMAAGLPVIGTDNGTVKEMIIDGENGFIIEEQNPKQIAEKIIFLLENEKMRREMGEKSRERFLKYYTEDKFINGLGRVFEEVLNE